MLMDYRLDSAGFKRLLEKNGFSSISEFADAASVHRNTLTAYLCGEKRVFPRTLCDIAASLGVDPLSLICPARKAQMSAPPLEFLKKALPGAAGQDENLVFLLLGSRAKGRGRKFSDWDIGISGGDEAVDTAYYLKLKSHIQDITEDFPFSVDVINLDCAPIWFLSDIDYKPVFLCGSEKSYYHFLGILNGLKKTKQVD